MQESSIPFSVTVRELLHHKVFWPLFSVYFVIGSLNHDPRLF